jgi:hypothetical protein
MKVSLNTLRKILLEWEKCAADDVYLNANGVDAVDLRAARCLAPTAQRRLLTTALEHLARLPDVPHHVLRLWL